MTLACEIVVRWGDGIGCAGRRGQGRSGRRIEAVVDTAAGSAEMMPSRIMRRWQRGGEEWVVVIERPISRVRLHGRGRGCQGGGWGDRWALDRGGLGSRRRGTDGKRPVEWFGRLSCRWADRRTGWWGVGHARYSWWLKQARFRLHCNARPTHTGRQAILTYIGQCSGSEQISDAGIGTLQGKSEKNCINLSNILKCSFCAFLLCSARERKRVVGEKKRKQMTRALLWGDARA